MQHNPIEAVEGTIVQRLDPIVVRASVQLMIPTEKELFAIIIDKLSELSSCVLDSKEEIDMLSDSLKKIQSKSSSTSSTPAYISVKDLARDYVVTSSQQKQFRGRIKDPLPFHQEGEGSKIRYKVNEIEEWLGKQKKR
jgi:hypothetical protein